MDAAICNDIIEIVQRYQQSSIVLDYLPRSAGWWLVAGLIWRERKTLLAGWLAGGWADLA